MFYQFTDSRPEADESYKYVSEVRVSGKAQVMQSPPAPLKPAEGAGWTSADTWYAEPPLGENPFDDWQELDPSRYFSISKAGSASVRGDPGRSAQPPVIRRVACE